MLSTAPVPAPYVPARFDVDDPAAYEYLNQHGYTVLKDVLTPAQVFHTKHLVSFLFLFIFPFYIYYHNNTGKKCSRADG